MLFCTNCGQQINDGEKYCSSCGTAVSNETVNMQRKNVFEGNIHRLKTNLMQSNFTLT